MTTVASSTNGRSAEPAVFGPEWPYILLRRLGLVSLLLAAGLCGLLAHLWQRWPGGLSFSVWMLGATVALLILNRLELMFERYVLTPSTVAASSGILRRLKIEASLSHVNNVVVYRSLRERVFGLGTVGIYTAAGSGAEVVWRMVAHPDEHAVRVRTAAGICAAGAPRAETVARSDTRTPGRLPVVGLAGGIGAGKSTVARVLADLGCLVIDSDARAKAALDRPEVRDQLVLWWGPGILGADGRVDRAGVSSIVFTDPAQRQRLESLVHPIVRQDRAAMIAEADGTGRFRAVVVDAPLLFEAGLDSECDAVIFVDAPEADRLARIKSRGWNEAEFRRREAAQLALAEKRRRSTHVVDNSAAMDADGTDVLRQTLGRILTGLGA